MTYRYTIRSAKVDDLEKSKRLLLQCGLPSEGLEDQFGESYRIAEHKGVIIGIGGIEAYGRFGLLRSIAVLPTWRGKSIGETLVTDLLAWAKSHSLFRVFLLTTTAAQFFERFGFQRIDRDVVPLEIKKSSEFSSVCPESAVVMMRTVTDSTSNH
jgi:amino-acid N-acetyltransferase